MKRFIVGLVMSLAIPLAAVAQDAKPLTVEQCINILAGLNSLNCAGEQLGDPSSCKTDSKQYKLGHARVFISVDIAALTPVLNGAQKEQQAFNADLPALPPSEAGKADSPERVDAAQAQNKLSSAHWLKIIAGVCPVTPGHIKLSDLNIGDGADENQIPPSVVGALVPIIDGVK